MDNFFDIINNNKFCFSKSDGQGYVDKSECTCTKENPCQAMSDRDKFHDMLKDIDEDYFMENRKEIIKKIKPEFEDSQWWKDNVIE